MFAYHLHMEVHIVGLRDVGGERHALVLAS